MNRYTRIALNVATATAQGMAGDGEFMELSGHNYLTHKPR